MLPTHWVSRCDCCCLSCAHGFQRHLTHWNPQLFQTSGDAINLERDKKKKLERVQPTFWPLFFGLLRPMWLLGSPSQVVMMDERLSPSARSVQSPGNNPSTVHSIEAILGFKEDTIFHKSASFSMTEKALGKDAERNGNVIVTPMKKSHYSESFDSKCIQFFSKCHSQIRQHKTTHFTRKPFCGVRWHVDKTLLGSR